MQTTFDIPAPPPGETHQETIARARAVKIGAWPVRSNEEIRRVSLEAHRALLFSSRDSKDIFREMFYTYGRMYIWVEDLMRATGRTRSNTLWPFSGSTRQDSTFLNAERWVIQVDGKAMPPPKHVRNGALFTLVAVLNPLTVTRVAPEQSTEPASQPDHPTHSLPLFVPPVDPAPPVATPAPIGMPTREELVAAMAAMATLAAYLGRVPGIPSPSTVSAESFKTGAHAQNGEPS